LNKYFKKIKRWWNKRKYHQDLPPYRAATKNNVKKEPYKECHNLDDVMKMFNEFVESVDKSQGVNKK